MLTKLLELNHIIEWKKQKSYAERLNQGLPHAYKHGIAICFDVKRGRYVGLKVKQGSRDVVYMEASGANRFSPTAVQPLSKDPASTVNKLKRSVKALSEATEVMKKSLKSVAANFDENKILGDVRKKLKRYLRRKMLAPIYSWLLQRVMKFFLFIEKKKFESAWLEMRWMINMVWLMRLLPLKTSALAMYVVSQGKRFMGIFRG